MDRRSFLGKMGGAAAVLGAGVYGLSRAKGAAAPATSPTADQVMSLIQSGQPLYTTTGPGINAAAGGWVPEAPAQAQTPKNILIVIVDQLRYFKPVAGVSQAAVDALLPNLAALRDSSISFENYYTAATACTPARGTLITGLYAPQTAQFLTEGNDSVPYLDIRFPTFGRALTDLGTPYANNVWWFGKWHLAGEVRNNSLTDYGFQTFRYPSSLFPSPNGWANEGAQPLGGGQWPPPGCIPSGCGPGQTFNKYYAGDADIVQSFGTWLAESPTGPWCAVVSLINPHDISLYPQWVDPAMYPSQNGCPTSGKNPNFADPITTATVYGGPREL